MSNFIRLFASLGLGLAIVFSLALTALILLFDINQYKPDIQTAVKEQSGLDLVFEGDLSMSVIPSLQIETPKLVLSKEGVKDQIHINSAAIDVALLPLLRGQVIAEGIEVNQLHLVGPNAEKSPLKSLSLKTDLWLKTLEKQVQADHTTLYLDDDPVQVAWQFNYGAQDLTASLTGEKLALDKLLVLMAALSPETAKEAAKEEKIVPPNWPKTALIPGDVLRAMSADVSMNIQQMTWQQWELNQAQLHLNLKDGVLNIDKAQGESLGGQISETAVLDVNTTPYTLKVTSHSKGIQSEGLLKNMDLDPWLKTTMNLDIELTTQGRSIYDWLNNAYGSIQFTAPEGQLVGLDLAKSVCGGIQSIQKRVQAKPSLLEGQTAFSAMKVDWSVINGRIVSKTTQAQLDGLKLNASGSVDLMSWKVDTQTGLLIESDLFETCEIPKALRNRSFVMQCKGSLKSEITQLCKPDYALMRNELKEVLKEKAKERALEEIQKKLSNPSDLFKGLFGR